jgi:hypothetical protein
MAKISTIAAAIALIALLIAALAFFFTQTAAQNMNSGGGEIASTPSACSSGLFVNEVNETSGGSIGLSCASPSQWIENYTANTQSCILSTIGLSFIDLVYTPSQTGTVIVTIDFSILASIPSHTSEGLGFSFVYKTSASTCGGSAAGWLQIGNAFAFDVPAPYSASTWASTATRTGVLSLNVGTKYYFSVSFNTGLAPTLSNPQFTVIET